MNYQPILETVYHQVLLDENVGIVASYIPELAKVSPDYFGVQLTSIDGQTFGVGDFQQRFSIQSIAKVITLVMAYKLLGEDLWSRLGVEPSGTPFNSLIQLEADGGIPRNPFINAGALVICDILMSAYVNPRAAIIDFFKLISGSDHIHYSKRIAQSELSTGFRNIALCNFIKAFGNINNKPEEVLDVYFHLCSIELSCEELSKTFLFLANGGKLISNQKEILTSSQTKRINAVMQTCGHYDESGEFTFKVGLPGKSGVGGGIVAIYPNQYAVTVWSPKLNPKGNSYRGMKLLELLTTETKSSIF